jgi:uncharacterized membrane protein
MFILLLNSLHKTTKAAPAAGIISLMWWQIHVAITLLLYLEFVVSGLSYMLLAQDVQLFRDIFASLPLCDWAISVYLLCLAHVLHAATIFGWTFACKYALIGLGVVSAMEEIGLRTFLIFGEYYFTPALGNFLTPNLPILVPFLWFALSYPIFVYTFLLVKKQKGTTQYWHTISCVLLASTLLAGYDLIAEPIGVLYGNQLWYHAAHVDSTTSLDTYASQPDWVFGRRPSGDSASSGGIISIDDDSYSPLKKLFLEVLSFPCHYGIPLHVSKGHRQLPYLLSVTLYTLSNLMVI